MVLNEHHCTTYKLSFEVFASEYDDMLPAWIVLPVLENTIIEMSRDY